MMHMKQHVVYILLLLSIFTSCSSGSKKGGVAASYSDTIHYAAGFTVKHYPSYREVEVRDPWDSSKILQRYILVDRTKDVPSDLPQGVVVRVPVKRLAVYSSVHCSMLEQLQVANEVVGVCEPRYIDSPIIQKGILDGTVADLGEATSPNVEKMIDINVEAILVSPFENAGYGPAEKLGLPIIECADYMEGTPLGRAEWIRFVALFFEKEEAAQRIFNETEKAYMDIKQLAAGVTSRPTVLSEKKFGASWFVPCGDSYMATLYADAGADYIFADMPGSGSKPLSFETVLDKAMHADYWLIKFNLADDMNYQALQTEYKPYASFDAFKNKKIYYTNTGKVPYYEEVPMHPDYLLKDLVWIFHPELLPDYKPRYFRRMMD